MKKIKKNKKKVQVVVLTKTEVLLLRTNKLRGNFWQNVTGSVDKNEPILFAAIREFCEETGLETSDIKVIHDLNLNFKFLSRFKKPVTEYCFAFQLTKKKKIKIDPSEHDKFIWKKISKIKESDFGFKTNHQAFKKALT